MTINKTGNIPKYLELEYIDNCIEQTLLWMNSISEHRNDECCVDFSCCYPEFLMEYEKRYDHGVKKLNELHDRRNEALNAYR